VNEHHGYMQATRKPEQLQPSPAALTPVTTCSWATDPYSSRQTDQPPTRAWVNEANGYLQKWNGNGNVVPTQGVPAIAQARTSEEAAKQKWLAERA